MASLVNRGGTRLIAWSVVGSAAAALVLACGRELSFADEPVEGGADSAADALGDASASGDAGGPVEVTIGSVKVMIAPPVLELVGGGAGGTFTVTLDRLVNDTTPVTVTYAVPTGLVIPPIPTIAGTATTAVGNVSALATAAPRQTVMNVQIQAGAAMATLPLVFRISRELREAGTTKFAVEPADGQQVYAVAAWGAGGDMELGGAGGFVSGEVTAPVGATVIVQVGAPGTSAATGAFPGGGVGGTRTDLGNNGRGGGGYSGVFVGADVSAASARLVAGAGGGGSTDGMIIRLGGGGGSVSTSAAQSGTGTSPGKGGSIDAGGAGGGGAPSYGSLLMGGPGADDPLYPGGGGGGGIFGGGGGGVTSGGGGGGSLTPALGTSAPGTSFGIPGMNTDSRRVDAGERGKAGAVLIGPK